MWSELLVWCKPPPTHPPPGLFAHYVPHPILLHQPSLSSPYLLSSLSSSSSQSPPTIRQAALYCTPPPPSVSPTHPHTHPSVSQWGAFPRFQSVAQDASTSAGCRQDGGAAFSDGRGREAGTSRDGSRESCRVQRSYTRPLHSAPIPTDPTPPADAQVPPIPVGFANPVVFCPLLVTDRAIWFDADGGKSATMHAPNDDCGVRSKLIQGAMDWEFQ